MNERAVKTSVLQKILSQFQKVLPIRHIALDKNAFQKDAYRPSVDHISEYLSGKGRGTHADRPHMADPPSPPPRGQTNTCKNITCIQTSYAAGNNVPIS